VIALVTDFGASGFYAGAMKGAILAADPDASIVDLTHGIRPFAVAEASFVLSLVFDYWAAGTVFLAVVDPGVGGDRGNLVIESSNRIVVCPDNGLVSDIASKFGVDGAYSIDDDTAASLRKHRPRGRTFLGRDLFAPVAAYLAAGGSVEATGTPVGVFQRLALPKVETRAGYVRGESRYVDDYGSVFTNVTGDELLAAFGDTPLAKIRAIINDSVSVAGVGECFAQGKPGELMVLLDSWNLIEISANRGRAVDRFPAGRPVVVELVRD
jgi:hypothetical protein